jgi:hypothetical protein
MTRNIRKTPPKALSANALHAKLYGAGAELGERLKVTPFPVFVETKSPVVQGFSWNGGGGKGKWQGCSALSYDLKLFGRLWIQPEVQRAARDGNLALAVALPDPYGVVDIDARGVEELPRDAYDRAGAAAGA